MENRSIFDVKQGGMGSDYLHTPLKLCSVWQIFWSYFLLTKQ
jgi:hypothetical protein